MADGGENMSLDRICVNNDKAEAIKRRQNHAFATASPT